ncbi:hypothetical protein pb186bvf_014729 [Paramecium bursaria]
MIYLFFQYAQIINHLISIQTTYILQKFIIKIKFIYFTMENFKKLDMFGSVFNMNINRNDKQYKSVIGGITSFLLYSCSLAYFIYKIYLWSSGQIQPNINSQSTSFEYQEHVFTEPPIKLNIFKSESDDDPFDLENNYITIFYQQFEGVIGTGSQLIIPQNSNTSGSSSLIIPQNISLVHNPGDQNKKQMLKGGLLIALCDPKLISYNITCASEEKLKNFINKFQSIQLWITVEMFDTENKKMQYVTQELPVQLDLYTPFLTQIQFKITEQNVDDNIFITTSQPSKFISSCNFITQPQSQQMILNQYGLQGYGMFMISLSSDGIKQKVTYPKLGQILADVGSIMSTLLSISIIIQLTNSFLLEDQILFQIIASYFPEIKNYQVKKSIFGKITSVQLNNKTCDKQQYQIQLDLLKEKARNKITFINQIYELSRLQFIIQGLVDRQTIINSHKLGIKWTSNEDQLNQQSINFQESQFQQEDFTILSIEQTEKQDDIRINQYNYQNQSSFLIYIYQNLQQYIFKQNQFHIFSIIEKMPQVATPINISFCLISSIVTILSIVAFASFSSSFNQYEQILENWKRNPITDIRISYSSYCQDNEILLNHYYFPGTTAGCDCTYQDNYYYYGIYTSYCNSNQTYDGCEDIYPVASRSFDYFIDPNYQKRFNLCGTQDKSYNFYDFGQYVQECPQGYKKCGSDQSFICTKNQKCPIVEFGYQNENQQTTNEYLDFGNGFKIWYNRESSSQMPLVETKIGEGNGVCAEKSQLSITAGRTDYVLMKYSKSNCIRDPRFKLLYKIREDQFYYINDSTDLPYKLPRFEINGNYQWGLYHRGYIAWKTQCKGEVFEKFIKQEPEQKSILNYQLTMIIFQIISFIGIGCACNFISIGKQVKQFQILNLILNILSILISSALAIVLFTKSKEQIASSKDVANLNCSDSFTSNIIAELADDLESKVYTLNLVIFAILMIALSLLILISIILVILSFMQRHKQTFDYNYSNENYSNQNYADMQQGNYNYPPQNQYNENQNRY